MLQEKRTVNRKEFLNIEIYVSYNAYINKKIINRQIIEFLEIMYEDYIYYHLTFMKKFRIIIASLMQNDAVLNIFSPVGNLIFRGRNSRVNPSIVSFMFRAQRYLVNGEKDRACTFLISFDT